MNAKPEDLPPVPDTDSRGWVMRQARTSDVPQIRRLIDLYAPDRRLLSKATVALYEDVQEFVVLEADAKVLATGALHVMWADLGEIRTVAVDPSATGRGFGSEVVEALIARARALDLGRVFCLTFETEFFTRFGFEHLEGAPVSA
nr:GNAT family N-acetyltransferase [Actinomycetes bacterium]